MVLSSIFLLDFQDGIYDNFCRSRFQRDKNDYNKIVNFHRYYYPGQIVFITQVVKDRNPVFGNPEALDLLREILKNVKVLHPFSVLAYVFLPDHFHILIHPGEQSNFSKIMHSLKSNFTCEFKKKYKLSTPFTFWQKRFWDHVIRDESDLENHIHYIHYNPIKHGYVKEMSTWQYSSYSVWQERGLYNNQKVWVELGGIN